MFVLSSEKASTDNPGYRVAPIVDPFLVGPGVAHRSRQAQRKTMNQNLIFIISLTDICVAQRLR
jgi:hypothetical protein